jgi:hypothetical protein
MSGRGSRNGSREARKRHRAKRRAAGLSLTPRDNAIMLCAFRETQPQLGETFEDLAGALGWDVGELWRRNPAIRLAQRMWDRATLN